MVKINVSCSNVASEESTPLPITHPTPSKQFMEKSKGEVECPEIESQSPTSEPATSGASSDEDRIRYSRDALIAYRNTPLSIARPPYVEKGLAARHSWCRGDDFCPERLARRNTFAAPTKSASKLLCGDSDIVAGIKLMELNPLTTGLQDRERRIGSGRITNRDLSWSRRIDDPPEQLASDSNFRPSGGLLGLRDVDREHKSDQPRSFKNPFSRDFRIQNEYHERRSFHRDGDHDLPYNNRLHNGGIIYSDADHSHRYHHNNRDFMPSSKPRYEAQRYDNSRIDRGGMDEPEWFSGGPTSKHDTIELRGFDENEIDEVRSKQKEDSPPAKSTPTKLGSSNRRYKPDGLDAESYDDLFKVDTISDLFPSDDPPKDNTNDPKMGRWIRGANGRPNIQYHSSNGNPMPRVNPNPFAKQPKAMPPDFMHRNNNYANNSPDIGPTGAVALEALKQQYRTNYIPRVDELEARIRPATGKGNATSPVKNQQDFMAFKKLLEQISASQQQHSNAGVNYAIQSMPFLGNKNVQAWPQSSAPYDMNAAAPNVGPRMPSPRELQFHTQTIMQGALMKKKLQDQYELFRKQQEFFQQHQVQSPTTPQAHFEQHQFAQLLQQQQLQRAASMHGFKPPNQQQRAYPAAPYMTSSATQLQQELPLNINHQQIFQMIQQQQRQQHHQQQQQFQFYDQQASTMRHYQSQFQHQQNQQQDQPIPVPIADREPKRDVPVTPTTERKFSLEFLPQISPKKFSPTFTSSDQANQNIDQNIEAAAAAILN